MDPRWRLFIATGFCGAYTTFSTFSYETIALVEYGHYDLAGLNFFANNALSIFATIAGILLARHI